ncbi:uncharacterized protein G2W53_021543 [Senna tora]|uniref:Uncharacterized protein n=1 Tax=Senna tora TaxID=362788 RepID=A0A834WNH8_9FABA|nr:uncharacterized protein G2W53_021543 [Senna tora]
MGGEREKNKKRGTGEDNIIFLTSFSETPNPFLPPEARLRFTIL